MKHLDLFSGIGGFAYALDSVYPNVEHIFCDNDPFCQQVLKKHWPNSKIYEDIRAIKNTSEFGCIYGGQKEQANIGNKRNAGTGNETGVYLLTGGFPCQPFSQAGKRRGTEDNRHLWPEMLRVIQLTQPQWVIAENVRGLLTISGGLVFEQVCLDLETSGYEVQPIIIPAVALNAPHRRDRVWFVAKNTQHDGTHQQEVAGSIGNKRNAGAGNGVGLHRKETTNAQNSISKRGSGRVESSRQVLERESTEVKNARPSWKTHWLEVATELCGVDDGLPVGLDGFELTKAGHRVERLKSLGNSIVPQVAIEIFKAIKRN